MSLERKIHNKQKGQEVTVIEAQISLWVLLKKDEILIGEPFDVIEEYANS